MSLGLGPKQKKYGVENLTKIGFLVFLAFDLFHIISLIQRRVIVITASSEDQRLRCRICKENSRSSA